MTTFRDVYNYYLLNNQVREQPIVCKIQKPDAFKNNLQKKEIRIQKFYINNKKTIPIFIPDRMIDTDYFNFTTSEPINTKYDNILQSTSLKYFIVLRNAGVESKIIFLRQPQLYADLPAPSNVIIDDLSYYTNKFYQYYDITHFLSVIEQAILIAEPTLLNLFWYVQKDNMFQFFYKTGTPWDVELSPSLYELFPFKTVKTSDNTYKIIPNLTTVSINSVSYYEADCLVYDTFFPYIQLVFNSENAKLNPIKFIDNQTLTNNLQSGVYENAILSYDIENNQLMGIYNFWKFVNLDDSGWVNFYSDRSSEQHLTINVYLRLKNNLIVPYSLGENEKITFSLELKYTH